MDEICGQTIDILIDEFEKPENQKKIKSHILNPIIKYMGNEIWPYVLISSLFFVILIVVLLIIIFLLNKHLKVKQKSGDL